MTDYKVNESMWPLGFGFIVVLILWIINLIIGLVYFDQETRGTAGDMFGAVNALFSGLAFAGVFLRL